MTAPFVNSLRTQGPPLILGSPSPGGQILHIRAQVLEAWDAIRIDADPSASVRSLKELALRELFHESKDDADYMVKFRGYEVLDEHAALSTTGARDGSIFVIADRRRRPVD